MTLIWGAPPSGRSTANLHTLQRNTLANAEYSYPGKMLKQMTPERSVNTSFQCSQPLFFSPLVTVNNLGLRRFIALHSKCSRRICVLWPSYWSNWEDVQQSKRNSWEPHRMHGVRKGIRALISLWQAIQAVFRGLVVDKATWTQFLPIFLCARPSICPPFQVDINRLVLNSLPDYLVSNWYRLLGWINSR